MIDVKYMDSSYLYIASGREIEREKERERERERENKRGGGCEGVVSEYLP